MILIIKSLSKCKSKPQRGTFTPTRMTKTNGTNSMFWQESSEIRIFIHPWCNYKMVQLLWESLAVPQNVNQLCYDLAGSLPGVYTQEIWKQKQMCHIILMIYYCKIFPQALFAPLLIWIHSYIVPNLKLC